MSVRVRAAAAFPLCAGIAGVLVPVVTLLGIVLSLHAAPWFSWTEHALSDLGIAAASASTFNGAMLLGGILLFVFSLGIRSQVSRPAGRLLAGSSLMLVGVGLVSMDLFTVHWLMSGLFFFLLIMCFVVLWLDSSSTRKNLAKSARVLVVVAVAACGLFWVFPGAALPETFVLVPAFFWCAGVGVAVLILPALAQKKTRRVRTPAMRG